MSECDHAPGAHPDRPFWFADILDEDDPGYDAKRPLWRAFLQMDGMVASVDSPLFFAEQDCLDFIRDEILKATTVCDD